MTKTEINLINRLLTSKAGVVFVGARDGKGYREVDAAESLRKGGILKIIGSHSGTTYNSNRAIHYFEKTYTWA